MLFPIFFKISQNSQRHSLENSLYSRFYEYLPFILLLKECSKVWHLSDSTITLQEHKHINLMILFRRIDSLYAASTNEHDLLLDRENQSLQFDRR